MKTVNCTFCYYKDCKVRNTSIACCECPLIKDKDMTKQELKELIEELKK